MKIPHKVLLISLIVILVLWFGSNLGLYLFTKYFVVGKESIELINKVPETIDISYKETAGQKIYFGDIEFTLAPRGYDSVEIYPSVYIDQQEVEKYSIYLILMFKYANVRKTITIDLNNTDLKLADDYIELSNYSIDDFSLWNTLHNYNSFYKLAAKWIMLPSNADLEKYPLSIVNTQYFKGFWKINSGKNTILSSFDFSTKGKSYTIMLVDSDEVVSTEMNNIISSIKPIEDSQNVIEILSSNYKKGVSIFEKQLALISLISIEGPTIDNLSELKKLLIQKGARTENIEDIEKQIDILSINANAVSNY